MVKFQLLCCHGVSLRNVLRRKDSRSCGGGQTRAQTADHSAATNRFHNLSSLGCILYAVARARIVGATGNAIRNIGAKKNN